jgi:YesN/AraC family two-component response regulator
MNPIKVLTVDDHPVLREGIAAIIENHADIVLVGEAGNGREAIECFRKLHPDITLMDLVMPEMNGIDATIAIRKEFPNARIVVLTTYKKVMSKPPRLSMPEPADTCSRAL